MDWSKDTDSDYLAQEAGKRQYDERWFKRQNNWPNLIYALIALAVVLGVVAFVAQRVRADDPQQRAMLKAAGVIRVQLSDYFQDNLTLPQSLTDLEGYMRPDHDWPLNPYTGLPVEDSGSAEFDPAKSPGTVHYEPLRRGGQLIGWKLYVFSAQGELRCYQTMLHMED